MRTATLGACDARNFDRGREHGGGTALRFPPGNARGSVRAMQLPRLYLLSAIALITLSSAAFAQDNAAPAKSDGMSEVDGSDLSRQLRDRADKIAALTDEEREKLRLAHMKAMDDPAVKAALA